jgi:uncharacterized metal-binding protein (TIGR02443 family)
MKEPIRRFIAGAVCPQCGAMDKLVLYVGSPQQRRECVGCGYQDNLKDAPIAAEPATRVNRARPGEAPLAHETEVQVLRLGEPGSANKN